MEPEKLAAIVADLYASIQLLSGYPVPDPLPEVNRIPQSVVQQLVCRKACRVQAFYHPDFGVLIDERLDIEGDVFDQSVLVHELVHHGQSRSGRFESLPSECHRRAASESEAYEIQNRFLASRNSPRRLPRLNARSMCGEEGSTPPREQGAYPPQ